MNRHFIIGNLTRDPEAKTTRDGNNYTTFTVAVNMRGPNGEERAEYIDVTTWRGLAENCAKFLKRGKKVCCIGESRAYGWIKQDGKPGAKIEMNARDVEFLSSGQGSGHEPEVPAWAGQAAEAAAAAAVLDGEPAGTQVRFTEVQNVEDQPW